MITGGASNEIVFTSRQKPFCRPRLRLVSERFFKRRTSTVRSAPVSSPFSMIYGRIHDRERQRKAYTANIGRLYLRDLSRNWAFRVVQRAPRTTSLPFYRSLVGHFLPRAAPPLHPRKHAFTSCGIHGSPIAVRWRHLAVT